MNSPDFTWISPQIFCNYVDVNLQLSYFPSPCRPRFHSAGRRPRSSGSVEVRRGATVKEYAMKTVVLVLPVMVQIGEQRGMTKQRTTSGPNLSVTSRRQWLRSCLVHASLSAWRREHAHGLDGGCSWMAWEWARPAERCRCAQTWGSHWMPKKFSQ